MAERARALAFEMDFAMLVDRPPKPVSYATHHDPHLVEMPNTPSPGLTLPQRLGQVGSELQAPRSHRLVTDIDAPLEEQFLHVPVRDGQAVVEINGVTDDQLGITVALRTLGRVIHLKRLLDPK